MPRSEVNKVDLLIAERVKKRRLELNLTRSELAEQLDVSWQQVQKYESGESRVTASRLYELADVLQRPVGWFFREN